MGRRIIVQCNCTAFQYSTVPAAKSRYRYRYMYLGRVMTKLQDTFRIHHATCIFEASSEPRWIHTRYSRESHCRYIQDTYPWLVPSALLPKELKSLRLFVAGVGLHLSEMQDTCGIHAGYMRDTCICKGNQDTCGIQLRYTMRYMYLVSSRGRK